MEDKILYITKIQKEILNLVTKNFKDYYLTGGTALSLYYNHRFSEDLDFFTQKYQSDNVDKIMEYINEKTGFLYKLESEQNNAKQISMKVYYLQLKNNQVLKVDFVQDFMRNIKPIENGLHSKEDIYMRKLTAAIGLIAKKSIVGSVISTGRQEVKDLYDIYYLSKKYESLKEFFMKHFEREKIERLIAWYKGFNRMNVKMELLDLVPGVDTSEVLGYLDKEILKEIPRKLMY